MSTNKYYGRLAESLMRKQTGIKLTEAWADTMPSWMEDRLNKMAGATDFEKTDTGYGYIVPKMEHKLPKYLRDPKFKQKFDQYISWGYDDNIAFRNAGIDLGYYDKTDYATPRGATSEEKKNARKNIFRQFKDILGLDLQNLTFVESAPPKTARDISLQDPNIPIWHIQSSGQIYAKGVNDNEVLNAPSSSYNGKSFRYVPLKELSALCGGDFCYIDGSNLPSINSKMQQRKEYDDWVIGSDSGLLRGRGEPGERVDIPYENAQGRTNIWAGQRDKSGFARVPSALRYARELEKMKASKYADKLLKVENVLRSAYSVLRSAQNVGTWSSPVDTRDFINQYKNALSSYKNLLTDIDMMRNKGDDAFMDYLISNDSYYRHMNGKWVPGFTAAISQIQNQMNYVNNYKDQYDTAIVDI